MIQFCSKLIILSLLFVGSQMAMTQESRLVSEDEYLLIIDIQDHFTRGKLSPRSSKILLGNINKVVESADPNHVIYVRSVLRTLSLSWSGFRVDTLENLDFDNRLKVVGDKIFEKVKPNAFSVDELCALLDSCHAQKVVIIGLMADHCVYHTVEGALDRGLQVSIIPQAIEDEDPDSKSKIVEELQLKGAILRKLNPQL